MNYNIGAYSMFIVLMVFIIVYVGRYFYTNGRVFIVSLLKGNVSLADYINRLLLAGYYLMNIGYAFLKQYPNPATDGYSYWHSLLRSSALS